MGQSLLANVVQEIAFDKTKTNFQPPNALNVFFFNVIYIIVIFDCSMHNKVIAIIKNLEILKNLFANRFYLFKNFNSPCIYKHRVQYKLICY